MKKKSYRKIISLAWLLCTLGVQVSLGQQWTPALIPYPSEMVMAKGNFLLTANTIIVTDGHLFDNECSQLNLLLEQYLGKRLKISQGNTIAAQQGKTIAAKNAITLRYDASIKAVEGYQLKIDAAGIVLSAKEGAGMFRGVETLRQLLPPEERSQTSRTKLLLPALKIADQPAYAWRGMHLDVSRHFFSISYLRKFIDLLALYKFNKFHIHLTDDQGWRIEIKKYPKLTAEGAWRTFNNQDSVCMAKAKDNPEFIIDPEHIVVRNGKTLYGGFYTQEEMKGIVAYASERHIDVIPEVDMPGHMMAAINSYPFLTCNGENKWGKDFTTPICPINEATFEFAQNVFTEIMDIFPSKYIHIGGDEVDRSSWDASEECKAFMLKNNFKHSAELQSYFINRMEKFFHSKNRQLIGWDEILEGGISSRAMVMYWRSWVPDAPVMAAKNGNKVIMSPGNPLYFDSEPDHRSLDQVYHFNPIPAGLTAAEAKGIVGAQANTWTETIPTVQRAEYMIFPRMTALAERLWSDNDQYDTYLKRLAVQYQRLDALGVNYRLPDISGLMENNVFVDQVILNPAKPLANMTLRYTTDGSVPDGHAPSLHKALTIKDAAFIRLAAFNVEGRRGAVYDLQYKKQPYAAAVERVAVKPGWSCAYFPGAYKSVKLMGNNPDHVFTVDKLVVPAEAKGESFGLKYSGFLDVPEDGIYSFYLTCDDGGILNIAGNEVINNDGWHPPLERNGQAALKKGLQPVALDFVEGGGGYTLKLKYSLNGSAIAAVPDTWFKH